MYLSIYQRRCILRSILIVEIENLMREKRPETETQHMLVTDKHDKLESNESIMRNNIKESRVGKFQKQTIELTQDQC